MNWIYPMPDQRALYFSVPKVACTTWLRICCRAQGIDLDQVERMKWFDSIESIPPSKVDEYPGWQRFGFIRNPWDRLVSCYLSKILPDANTPMPGFVDGIQANWHDFGVFRAGMPFPEFARAVCEIPDEAADAHFMSQHRFFQREGKQVEDLVLHRFEDAETTFPAVLQSLGLPADSIPHDKKTVGRKPYTDYYEGDDELVAQVAARYAQDLEQFDYTFGRD